jgi:hypothetical protein
LLELPTPIVSRVAMMITAMIGAMTTTMISAMMTTTVAMTIGRKARGLLGYVIADQIMSSP